MEPVRDFLDIRLRKYGDLIIFGLLSVVFLSSYRFRTFEYFRDYAMIYDGAYRISIGEFPYKNFGMPVGPISLFVPAGLFYILGASWDHLIVAQQLLNVAHLGVFTLTLRSLRLCSIQKYLAMAIFSVFYLLTLSHSWYNNTAALLLAISILLSLSTTYMARVISGFTMSLCILCKQDYGLLSVIVCFMLVLLRLTSSKSDFATVVLHQRIQKVLAYTFPILMTLFCTTAIAACIMGIDEFMYWFNYGQKHQIHRSFDKDLLFKSSQFLFCVAASSNYVRTRHLADAVCSLVLFASSVVSQTSGLTFTSNFFVGYIPIVIARCFWSRRTTGIIATTIAVVMSAYVFKPQINNVRSICRSAFLHLPEHYGFQGRDPRWLVRIPPQNVRFGTRTFVPDETLDLIKWFQNKYIREGVSKQYKVLNMSELTPLTSSRVFNRTSGLPLWFHTGVTLFPREIVAIENHIISGTFDIIILQGTHEGISPTIKRLGSLLSASSAYRQDAVYVSPATHDNGTNDYNIVVFIKQ